MEAKRLSLAEDPKEPLKIFLDDEDSPVSTNSEETVSEMTFAFLKVVMKVHSGTSSSIQAPLLSVCNSSKTETITKLREANSCFAMVFTLKDAKVLLASRSSYL